MAMRSTMLRAMRSVAPNFTRAPMRAAVAGAHAAPFTTSFSSAAARGAMLAGATFTVFGGATVAFAATSPEESSPSKEEIAACVAAIEELLDDNDEMGPTIVRLAWHGTNIFFPFRFIPKLHMLALEANNIGVLLALFGCESCSLTCTIG